MAQTLTLGIHEPRRLKDLRLYAGEDLEVQLLDRPSGAGLVVTLGADPSQPPTLERVGAEDVTLTALDLGSIREGTTAILNVWLRHHGALSLLSEVQVSMLRSLAPETSAEPPAPASLTATAQGPTLIVDGDSVMARSGARDMIIAALGEVTRVQDGHMQATGGHTILDMLDSAPQVVSQIVPDETLIVLGPIGANAAPGLTLADYETHIGTLLTGYTQAGAQVLAIPTLPDGRDSATEEDPHGNDAFHAGLVQILTDHAAQMPKVHLVDVSGFDPVTMKSDRTHPNVSHGAAYLARQVRAAGLPLIDSTRWDGPNLLQTRGIFAGQQPLSLPGVTGIRPEGWAVARASGSADWTVSQSPNGGVVVACASAASNSILTLSTEVTPSATAGDVFDALFELWVDPASTGFAGAQVVLPDGTALGDIQAAPLLGLGAWPLFPHALTTEIPTSGAAVNLTLKLAVQAGGSVSMNLKRAHVLQITQGAADPVPQIQTAPSVTPLDPQEGDILTATAGIWTPTPDSVTYTWLRDGAVVPGETLSTLSVPAGAAGARYAVQVRAHGSGGWSAPATSDQTQPVTTGATVIALDDSLNVGTVPQVIYSDLNRTAQAAASINSDRYLRGAQPFSGKAYFEIAATRDVRAVGVCDTAITIASAGSTGTNRAFWSGGYLFHTGAYHAMPALADGDRVQVAVDTSAGLIWMRANAAGNWNHSPGADPETGQGGVDISGITGALYPHIALKSLAGAEASLHGSVDRLLYAPPLGFAALG